MRARPGNDAVKPPALVLLAVLQVSAGTSVTVTTTPGIPTIASPSICPSRSINYITQTLPQQCFTSSWASKPIAQNITALATASFDALATLTAANVSISPSINAFGTVLPIAGSPRSAIDLVPQPSGYKASPTTAAPESSRSTDPAEESSLESDPESPLDNAHFLSFEEWKHQNLAKAGQSAETLGSRVRGSGSELRRRPGGINNALEALGEDPEIDIDFSGFVNAGGMNDALPVQSTLPRRSSADDQELIDGNSEELSSPHRRSKDAGKTCKERSNYASFDCAATALKANPECKGSTSVLVESKDSYMLNVCSAKNKFFIVELCDDILIDTIVLANFEYFSSMFRTFRVSVSDRYPVKMDKWKELGTFEARNSREIQAFLVENPLIWARYLRVEFLTHYGAEYFCPVSLLRVHGTTMMEEFNHEVKGSRGEDEAELEVGGSEDETIVKTPEVVSADVLNTAAQAISQQTKESVPLIVTLTTALSESVPGLPLETANLEEGQSAPSATEGFTPYDPSIAKSFEDMLSCNKDREGRCSHVHQTKEANPTSIPLSNMVREPERSITGTKEPSVKEEASPETQLWSEGTSVVTQVPPPNASAPSSPLIHNGSVLSVSTNSSTSTSSVTSSVRANSTFSATSSTISSISVNSTSSATGSVTSSARNDSTMLGTSSIKVSFPSTAITSVKIPSASTQAPAANPGTQESFFKSVHKRLQQLEANSTLSLQYIEEQSRILRDAFSKVEKRQLAKTSTFLETLNTTVLTELREFRMQYDQIWQSTVLELSSQREQSAHEVSALSARMAFLADEIVLQKRMAMVQFMLILLCLGLIIFSRYGGASTYLELPPLVQNAINKSSANLARYTHFETPPGSPLSTRPPSTGTSSKYGLFRKKRHQRNLSGESDMNGRAQSPTIAYPPPTPESQICREDRDASPSGASGDESDNFAFGSPSSGNQASRETKCSPTTPNGMREQHQEHLQERLLTPKAPVAEKETESPRDHAESLVFLT